MPSLYDTDYTAWAEQTAKLLRESRFDEIDMPALLEEIDGLARSDRKAIYSQLKRLIFHLIKMSYFSAHHDERSGAGWKRTVVNARNEIEEVDARQPELGSVSGGTFSRGLRQSPGGIQCSAGFIK